MNLIQTKYDHRLPLLIGIVAGLTLIVALGCQTAATPVPEILETPTAQITATARPSRTPTAVSSPAEVNSTIEAVGASEDTDIKLTLWTVEDISPKAEGEPGSFVSNSLRAFERANPGVKVDLLIKKPSGKGGMLDFLRTAQDVAPTILPDVAILEATDLNQAQANGLIQPLNGRLDRSIIQDLLPAARRMGTINAELVGIPLSLEMEHTVYDNLSFNAPPVLWSDVLSANTRYLFPAKGVNGLVNDLTLAQYFSAGGKLVDDEGSPTIDETVLRNVLMFYKLALENETIDESVLEAASTEELWPKYLDGQAGVAQITVRQFLTDRELLMDTAFTPLPVQSNNHTPVLIAHGRVMALVTDSEDLQRQEAALRLIEWFMSTNNNASWNQINKSIPTREKSYQQLAGGDSYWDFIGEQLNRAQPQPSFAGYDRLGRILQQAVVQVISGEATPEEATATAIDALTQ